MVACCFVVLIASAVMCRYSSQVVSDPVGYGFVIRGNNPVYVHSVDPMGPAAAAGLHVSVYVITIGYCGMYL